MQEKHRKMVDHNYVSVFESFDELQWDKSSKKKKT